MRSQKLIDYRKLNNLCVYCGKNEPISGRDICKVCSDKKNAQRRANREYRKRIGMCTKCGKHEAEPNGSLCYECRDKNKVYYQNMEKTEETRTYWREKVRKNREKKLSKGLCVRCGRPNHNGKASCDFCLGKDKRRGEKTRTNYIKTEWGSAGLCAVCGSSELVEGKKVCPTCYGKLLVSIKKAQASNNHKYWSELENSRRMSVKAKRGEVVNG